jgi:glycosyltransferase involved in cell wall biosynthesis
MPKRIALLHYASPPVIGGVEAMVAQHARELVRLGYSVRIISGDGAPFDPAVETWVEGLFSSQHPQVLAVMDELRRGVVSEAFYALRDQQLARLKAAFAGCDVRIAHNMHTLHINLPLTAALHCLDADALPIIAWCHDVAWANPLNHAILHAGYPWDLLRQRWTNTHYVTISEPRRQQLAALLDLPAEAIPVITPGVDVAHHLRWTNTMRALADRLNLLDAHLLLLLPARLTHNKNIMLALEVLAALRHLDGRDARLIVTGPPDPHHPASGAHLAELVARRDGLGLADAAHLLYALDDPPLIPDDATMANLYGMADALLFPSLREGFGIPMLEAGLSGLPIFCADLPPFRHTAGDDAIYFDPTHDSPGQIARLIQRYFADHPQHRFKTRVRTQYRSDLIVRTGLVPLIESI